MAGPRRILKNTNLYFGGNSYAGSIIDWNPPKLTLQTEDFRGGGMDAPIKITQGLQALDCDFSVIDFNPALLGAISPREGADRSFIIREALEDWDGTVTAREIIMRGKVTGLDEGTHTPGQQAQVKVSMNLNYYSDTIGGNMVNEIDVINMTWLNNGTDMLADIRSAIGL